MKTEINFNTMTYEEFLSYQTEIEQLSSLGNTNANQLLDYYEKVFNENMFNAFLPNIARLFRATYNNSKNKDDLELTISMTYSMLVKAAGYYHLSGNIPKVTYTNLTLGYSRLEIVLPNTPADYKYYAHLINVVNAARSFLKDTADANIIEKEVNIKYDDYTDFIMKEGNK